MKNTYTLLIILLITVITGLMPVSSAHAFFIEYTKNVYRRFLTTIRGISVALGELYGPRPRRSSAYSAGSEPD